MPGQVLQTGLAALLWAGSALAQGGGLPWLSPVYPLFTAPLKFGSEITPKTSVLPAVLLISDHANILQCGQRC